MIDVDNSGALDKAEVVDAVKSNQKVIKFLVNCAAAACGERASVFAGPPPL